jgi:type IV secretory pathway VirB2 component (pilin)
MTQNNKSNHLSSNKRAFAILALLTCIGCFLPEPALAAGKDAFSEVYTKLSGWIGGSAGKVITIIAIFIAGLMGALGFSGRHVAGALGVGLLLSLATTVVDMIFG